MTVRKAASRLTVGKVRQRAEILEALEGLRRLGAVSGEEIRQAEIRLTAATPGQQNTDRASPTSGAKRDHVAIK